MVIAFTIMQVCVVVELHLKIIFKIDVNVSFSYAAVVQLKYTTMHQRTQESGGQLLHLRVPGRDPQ
mgnify:CR=1 FL=1